MVRVLIEASSVLLFILALVGMVLRLPLWRAGAACFVQLFAFQLWFQFSERHRYFMVPILLLLAVEGARRLADLNHRQPVTGAAA